MMNRHIFFILLLMPIVIFFGSCSKLKTFITETEAKEALNQTLEISSTTSYNQGQQVDLMNDDINTKLACPQSELISMDIVQKFPTGNATLIHLNTDLNTQACIYYKELKPLMDEAIMNPSYDDVYYLIEGDDSKATNYIKDRQASFIQSKLTPILETKLNGTALNNNYYAFTELYNIINGSSVLNESLSHFLSESLTKRYFYLMSIEETKIRTETSHQTTDVLQKVFNSN